MADDLDKADSLLREVQDELRDLISTILQNGGYGSLRVDLRKGAVNEIEMSLTRKPKK